MYQSNIHHHKSKLGLKLSGKSVNTPALSYCDVRREAKEFSVFSA